jgi:hypothetical protein
MDSPGVPTTAAVPCTRRMVLGAALITLSVTLLRLFLELGKAPAWLANRDAGGTGALVGIAWLPLFFGPYFTHRLRTGAETTWTLLKRVLKKLALYGWSAHIPVVVITFLAIAFGWDTHFNNFGPGTGELALWKKVVATLAFQLVFWSLIWTPVVGGLAGLLFHVATRKRVGGAAVSAFAPR